MTTAQLVLLTLVFGLPWSSHYEWYLHKYYLHRPFKFFPGWFEDHTRIHHVKFGFNETYHLQHKDDEHIIDMRKWAPYVIAGGCIPYVVVGLSLYFFFDFQQWWIIIATGTCLSVAYYFAYEELHKCMHLPKERRVEMSQLFRRLNGHHLIHHRHMKSNFNVVLPLADWYMRTLLLRATVRFKQPVGPAVPNVQPLD